jgi:predicted dehydrogenase
MEASAVRTVNVGLIGAGFMGKAHSLAYAAMPMFFWPAPALPVRRIIADTTMERARDDSMRFGFERATDDWRRIIDDPLVELVDIATPNNLHAEIAIAAAQAGKHIICEKPLAGTVEEARAMYEAVRDAGVVNMVAFNYRRTPAVVLAKRLVEEGAIGRILNFRGTYLQDWSAKADVPLSWRFQKSVAGSGALGDIGTHVLDTARYLVGEIDAVTAVMATYIRSRPTSSGEIGEKGRAVLEGGSRGEVDVDDEVVSMLRFHGGAIGSLEATRNAFGRSNFLTFELHGSAGSIYFNYERRDELQVCFSSDQDDRRGFRTIFAGAAHPYGEHLWPCHGIGLGETKIIEAYELFRGIVGQTAVSPDFSDGYRIAQICDGISASALSGEWVDLPLPVGTSGPLGPGSAG